MSRLRWIIGFARSVDVAALRSEIADLENVGRALNVLAAAAGARDGLKVPPATATTPEPRQNSPLSDRIERLLELHQPRREATIADDLRTATLLVTATMEDEPDRFRSDRDGWWLVRTEARL